MIRCADPGAAVHVARARLSFDRALRRAADAAIAAERAAVLSLRASHAVASAGIEALDDAGHTGDRLAEPAAARVARGACGRGREAGASPARAPAAISAGRADALAAGARARTAIEAVRTRGISEHAGHAVARSPNALIRAALGANRARSARREKRAGSRTADLRVHRRSIDDRRIGVRALRRASSAVERENGDARGDRECTKSRSELAHGDSSFG